MPRASGTVVENDFLKGLITETTELRFPTTACTETFDCVFGRTGTASRRLGFDLEDNHTALSTSPGSTDAYTEYLWTSVAGNGNKNILVTQQGNVIRFYTLFGSSNVGENLHSTTLDLDDYIPSGSALDPAVLQCQYTAGRGILVIVNPGIDPIYVTYDPDLDDFTATTIEIRIRDFEGMDDGLGDGERPAIADVATCKTVNPEHYYNLLNQGWYAGGVAPASTGDGLGGGGFLATWDAGRSDLPSNIDYINFYRDVDGIVDFSTLLTEKTPGSSRAPRGHFILNVFDPDRTAALTADGFSATIPDTYSTTERPSSVAFFAGRVFYAGINFQDLSNTIYFTQIIENDNQYGKCYQVNDPTAQELFDLLPSDGGTIKIPEIGSVTKIFPYRTSLIIIANNGVWIVSGSSGAGFLANDYSVKKISSLGSFSPMSVVDFQGIPVWWGETGILTVNYDPNYDSFTVVSLTDATIRSFILDIPDLNRKYVKGTYDIVENILYWVYNSSADLDEEDYYTYDRIMVHNGITKAFYPWTVPSTTETPTIRGIQYVYDGSRADSPVVKYLILTNDNKITFAEERSETYKDWTNFHNAYTNAAANDYTSYLITGYRLDGQGNKLFQSNYVNVFMEQTNNASCYLQGLFDFTNSPNTGKWSTSQQVYRSGLLNRNVNYSRIKVRGKGRSLQLRFSSDSGKPFVLLGWTIWVTGNSNV